MNIPVAAVGEMLPYAFLRLALAEGQFPILPWLSLYLLGIVAGRWLTSNKMDEIKNTAQAFFILAVLLTLIWFVIQPQTGSLLWRTVHTPMIFFPSSMALSCLLLGVVLLLIRWGFLYEQKNPFNEGHLLFTNLLFFNYTSCS